MRTKAPLRTLALAVLVLAIPAWAKDTSEAAFSSVKADVTGFRADAKKRQYRHNYVKLVKRLQDVADTHPGGSHADDALYVAAQLAQELYETSRVAEDLDNAIDAYQRVADAYPDSNLADDALLAGAQLAFEKQSDAERARKLLGRIAAMKVPADRRAEAERMLAGLPAAEKRQQADKVLERVAQELVAQATPPVPQVEVLPDAPPEGTAPRQVANIEHVHRPDESIVRLSLDGPVGVTRGEVPPDGDTPKRIFYDLKPAKLAKKLTRAITVGDGVIRRVRAGQYDVEVVRLVVELEGDEEPLLTLERDPFELRLTVNLEKQRETAPLVAVRAEPELNLDVVKQRLGNNGAPGGVPLSAQMGLQIRRIVLDPGHGGHDTGAIGKKGTREKDVALKIAKEVRAKLLAQLPGIEVIMTRDDDTFIPLEDRTRIANEAGADLFISIHCNANPSRKVRGVETYYLNITHDRYAIRLAARENTHTADTKNISDLQFILADLAMKSNVDESIRLGREVQGSVVGRLKQDWTDTRDHGLKHALFYVLMGARMPAILVETSFISNQTEESRLSTGKYREALADGIVRGVARFVEQRQAFYAPDAR